MIHCPALPERRIRRARAASRAASARVKRRAAGGRRGSISTPARRASSWTPYCSSTPRRCRAVRGTMSRYPPRFRLSRAPRPGPRRPAERSDRARRRARAASARCRQRAASWAAGPSSDGMTVGVTLVAAAAAAAKSRPSTRPSSQTAMRRAGTASLLVHPERPHRMRATARSWRQASARPHSHRRARASLAAPNTDCADDEGPTLRRPCDAPTHKTPKSGVAWPTRPRADTETTAPTRSASPDRPTAQTRTPSQHDQRIGRRAAPRPPNKSRPQSLWKRRRGGASAGAGHRDVAIALAHRMAVGHGKRSWRPDELERSGEPLASPFTRTRSSARTGAHERSRGVALVRVRRRSTCAGRSLLRWC